jgi:hypothetical protein
MFQKTPNNTGKIHPLTKIILKNLLCPDKDTPIPDNQCKTMVPPVQARKRSGTVFEQIELLAVE